MTAPRPSGRTPVLSPSARPRAGGEDAPLAKLYKEMPADDLARQGREHLVGNTRERARRHLRLGWLMVWTLAIGALLVIGAFSLWLLFMARSSGTSFSQVRQQAMSAYTNQDD